MYTLYTHPISQHARRVVALLELAGIPYEPRIVNLAKGEHMAPDYLKVNPNHQVPTLVDGDIVIHESGAILRWLCHRHDLGDWYPADFRQRAAIEQWLDWTQCKFGVAVSAIVFNTLFAGERADKEALRRGQQSLTELLPILESSLSSQDWLAGGALPSIADIAAGTNIAHLGLAGAAPDSPAITAWHKRLCALPGFAKALPPQMAAA